MLVERAQKITIKCNFSIWEVKMRIGVELAIKTPILQLVEYLKDYDSYGFDRVWVPDSSISEWEVWTTAALASHLVKNSRIGVGVMAPYHRNPATIAHAAATLDQLSNGRIDLTLGRGSRPYLKSIDADRPDEAVEESITLINELLTGEKVSMKGSAFTFSEVSQRVTKKQDSIPIYIASMSEYWHEIASRTANGLHVYSTNEKLLTTTSNIAKESTNKPFNIITTLGYVEPKEVREWWVNNFGKHYNLQKLSGREPGEASISQLESELTFTNSDELKIHLAKMKSYGIEELMIAYRRPEDLPIIANIVEQSR
tara:strand:+ start:505 stop:1443 length:939 start_codon:yes stop_codon:yes gene_type:complete